MTEISTHSLMLAISSMIADRERLIRKIDTEATEVDEEEHFTELVMDIDRALNEFVDIYETRRDDDDDEFPSYEQLLESATSDL